MINLMLVSETLPSASGICIFEQSLISLEGLNERTPTVHDLRFLHFLKIFSLLI